MPDDVHPPKRDYRETVFLPETAFPMRGGLPSLEPRILAAWGDLYADLRAARQAAGAPLFVLHDGPPYANGAIHIGHALNKLLKDFVVRSRFALGFDVDYVPGWDCHGLPIEWKIEEEFRAKGRRKDEVSKAEFRARCRDYAAGWIEAQSREFQRLGVLGDWAHRYATMDYATEAAIVARVPQVPRLRPGLPRLQAGDVEPGGAHRPGRRRGGVPRPRLAHGVGEVPGGRGPDAARGASVVIWTTTPWTLPANRAIAYNPKIAYAVYEVEALEADLPFEPWAKPGDRLILAEALAERGVRGGQDRQVDAMSRPIDCEGMVCAHPLAGARSRIRLRGAAAGRRPRHRRRRHRLRPHRARPRRRRLRPVAGATAIARSPRPSTRTAPTIRTSRCSAA